MVRRKRYSITLFFLLGAVMYGAAKDNVTHTFNEMSVPSAINYTDNNTKATTDFVNYTCTGAKAKFDHHTTKTGNKIAIFLEYSGDQVVMSPPIQNLDSLYITYLPTSYKEFTVSVSKDSITWQNLSVRNVVNGVRTVKMPSPDNYYVRFKYKSSNSVYITSIKYIFVDLSGCPNCFIYHEE